MIIEKFSYKMMSSGIFSMYIATGFFGILIFFILNSDQYSPLEMMLGTIVITIALKGISNIMLSLIILLFNFKNMEDKHKFKEAEDKLNYLLNELQIKETNLKVAKVINK
jgi:hypothetical protein